MSEVKQLTFSAEVNYVDGKINEWKNMELKIGAQTIYPVNSPTVPSSSAAASKNTAPVDTSSTALVNASSRAPVDASSTALVAASSTAPVDTSSTALVDASSTALVVGPPELDSKQTLSWEEKKQLGEEQTNQVINNGVKQQAAIKEKEKENQARGRIDELDGGSKNRKSKRRSYKKNKRRNTKRQQYR